MPIRCIRPIRCLFLLMILVGTAAPGTASAQDRSPCGLVDSIDYPIDGISADHDDFGMYRAGFNGRHTGIDMAFGRYGDPVRAAARGRVTFADPAGWDTEKGVVIIEHTFPDSSIFFTLYGHMEPINGHIFPQVGKCVERGDIVGAVGHPSRGAPHLHYEIRVMDAVTGGPGYWSVDPLDGGWLHPIDFTEQWQLRLTPAFRSMMTAGGGPSAPPLWEPDGSAIFAEEYHLEQRTASGERLWRLDVQGLTGIIHLPDGRILGSTTDNQIIIVDNARFADSWQADRPLRSPPLRLGDSLVFLATDNRVVSYTPQGTVQWQTPPLGAHIERYAQSGDQLAVSTAQDGAFKLWVIGASGSILYQATAPVPVSPAAAPGGGFLVMVASQVGQLGKDMTWQPLMDIGQALGRNSQVAIDPQGNAVLYPGQGQTIYAYNANGSLRWQTELARPQRQPPLVGFGSGCLSYVLTAEGALLAYRMKDGTLSGTAPLYAGGPHGNIASRFLSVSPQDQVQFSAGYLSIATMDGPTLAHLTAKEAADCQPKT